MIAVAVLGICLYRHYKKQHVAKNEEVEIQDTRPAYEIALERLNAIRQEKLWQKGRPKDYHTALTDVLRDYIRRRFEINATEQTSAEVLQAIQPCLKEQKESFVLLQNILQLADLVKFAKYHPLIEEDEKSLSRAYSFVENTKQVVEETPTTDDVTNQQA